MCGLSRVTCRRAIRTGSWSPPKPGNERMAARSAQIGIGVALCLIAAATPAAAHGMKFRNAQVEPLSFAKLDGWKSDDQAAAFQTYMKSCGAILQGTRAVRAARPVYGGLYKACEKAAALAAAGSVDRAQARKFFEDNFKPVRILPEVHTYGYYTGADGFYTGYYEAEVAGSRVKTKDYNVPFYGVPAKIAGKKSTVFSQYNRTEIEKGVLAGKGLELCWVKIRSMSFSRRSRARRASSSMTANC